jgi:hypothetical protein
VVALLVLGAGSWMGVRAYRSHQYDQRIAELAKKPEVLFDPAKAAAIPKEDREAAFKKMAKDRDPSKDPFQRYASITDPKERTQALDKMIDGFIAMRKQFEAKAIAGGKQSGPASGPSFMPPPGKFDPAAIAKMMQSMPPAQKAQMAQFMSDFSKRMKERGLQ